MSKNSLAQSSTNQLGGGGATTATAIQGGGLTPFSDAKMSTGHPSQVLPPSQLSQVSIRMQSSEKNVVETSNQVESQDGSKMFKHGGRRLVSGSRANGSIERDANNSSSQQMSQALNKSASESKVIRPDRNQNIIIKSLQDGQR